MPCSLSLRLAVSFDPETFLDVAAFNAADTEDEARLRTAVGRAYYGSFLAAREKLGVRTHTGRVHREVIGSLKRRDPAAGNQLDKLEELRGLADYQLAVRDQAQQDWRRNWEMARQYAQHILNRIRRLPVAPVR